MPHSVTSFMSSQPNMSRKGTETNRSNSNNNSRIKSNNRSPSKRVNSDIRTMFPKRVSSSPVIDLTDKGCAAANSRVTSKEHRDNSLRPNGSGLRPRKRSRLTILSSPASDSDSTRQTVVDLTIDDEDEDKGEEQQTNQRCVINLDPLKGATRTTEAVKTSSAASPSSKQKSSRSPSSTNASCSAAQQKGTNNITSTKEPKNQEAIEREHGQSETVTKVTRRRLFAQGNDDHDDEKKMHAEQHEENAAAAASSVSPNFALADEQGKQANLASQVAASQPSQHNKKHTSTTSTEGGHSSSSKHNRAATTKLDLSKQKEIVARHKKIESKTKSSGQSRPLASENKTVPDVATALPLTKTTTQKATVNNTNKTALSTTDTFNDNDKNNDNDFLSLIPPVQNVDPFTLDEFLHLWQKAEENHGATTEEIERGSLVRGGNNKMDIIDEVQERAQYGRLLPKGLQVISEKCNLSSNMVFLDIGHGIGNAPLQAAYTTGCEARGIEVMDSRFLISEIFQEDLKEQHEIIQTRDRKKHNVGQIRLVPGSIAYEGHENFLTKGVDLTLCNNAHDVFGDRSARPGQRALDCYVARLFALMKPHAKLVTLSPIRELGPTLSEANEIRKRSKLPEDPNASHYEMEMIKLGDNVVSWSCLEVDAYMYTRTVQNVDYTLCGAVFLCSNPRCSIAQAGTPIPVAVGIEDGILNEQCTECGSARARATRKRHPSKKAATQKEEDDEKPAAKRTETKKKQR